MNLHFKLAFTTIATLLALALQAQSDSVFHPVQEVLIPSGTDSLALDSFPVVAASLAFTDSAGTERSPQYTLRGGNPLVLRFSSPTDQPLHLRYRRIAMPLYQVLQRKDTSIILPAEDFEKAQLEENIYRSEGGEFTPFEGLSSQGSISRSVSVGNNQDAVLNSDLNLQISGNIGSNTELRASITDNSLPVQPDGTTQQLREFDRVYLELENPDFGMLRAGDYDIQSSDNYLLRFQKRISGGGVYTSVNAGDGTIPLQLEGGIARGKFARNRFQGQEGNQGPYRLRGADNENFIVIISGSERVYIDGILQKRGQQNDYVIDYNAGEITFTALQPITKDKRIVVEFQYTEQNFLRSVAHAATGFATDDWQTKVHFYSEQDSKNRQLVSDYTDDEKRTLAEAGDNRQEAVVSTVRESEFNDEQVFYELTDTLGFDSVLVFSQDSTRRLYTASFAFLGENKGNYRQAQNQANGRVFRWVAPENGVPQGSYEPVRELVAPNQLQVLTVNTGGKISENQNVSVLLAASRNDQNLFSERDQEDNVGTAGRLQYGLDIPLEKGMLEAAASYEFNEENYTTIERIRGVEFARDWNLPLNYLGKVQLGEAQLGYRSDSLRLRYGLEFLSAEGTQGQRHQLRALRKGRRSVLDWTASVLNSNDTTRNTRFYREQGEYRYFLKENWWTGTRSVGEWNLQRPGGGDSLRDRSYSFFEYEAFSGVGDTSSSFVEMGFLQRLDDTARAGVMQRFSVANTYFMRGFLKTNFNSRVNVRANVRNLRVVQPEELPLERTVTTRVNYVQRLFSNAIVSNSFYEAGSGSEPRRTFSYVEVPAGTGTHTHTDYNDNGIKELDEFETAPTQDLANYVRVFSPSNEFVRTSLVKLGQNLNINAPFSWQQAEGLKKTLSKFALLFNYQLDRKTLLTGTGNQLDPFSQPEEDSLIVGLNNNFRSTLFFNRAQTSFGADYTFRESDNRNLLSFGVEGRRIRENVLNLRFGFSDAWIFRVRGSISDMENSSGNFDRRNFDIESLESRFSLSYQPGSRFTLTGSFEWGNQESDSEAAQNILESQDAGLELNYNLAEEISLLVDAHYIYNGFEGESNSPAGFEMLQALQPGNNATLNITLQRTFLKNIVLNLNYNGRFSSESFAIHTGNIQVKAFF